MMVISLVLCSQIHSAIFPSMYAYLHSPNHIFRKEGRNGSGLWKSRFDGWPSDGLDNAEHGILNETMECYKIELER